jgi:hypothetical protein
MMLVVMPSMDDVGISMIQWGNEFRGVQIHGTDVAGSQGDGGTNSWGSAATNGQSGHAAGAGGAASSQSGGASSDQGGGVNNGVGGAPTPRKGKEKQV